MFRRFALAGVGTALVAASFAFAMTASQWKTASALTNCTTSGQALDASEQQLLTLINNFRAANGVGALKASPNLSRAAAWMSEDQSSKGTFSHTDSLGRSPFARVLQCGYATSGAGENLALTSSAQGAFTLWQNSTAGHRQNMLQSSWKVVGLGHAGNIWTADFGSLDDSGQPWDSGASTTVANTPVPTSTPKPPDPAPVLPLKRAILPLVSAE